MPPFLSTEFTAEEMFRRFLGGDAALYSRLQSECLSESNPCGLTDDERIALWIYSCTDQAWYMRINGELWETAGAPTEEVKFLEELLNLGLAKLPRHAGQVYRGYEATDLDAFISTYDVDMILRYPGFTSTSRTLAKAFSGNVFFTIRSQNRRVLDRYADRPFEEEVLFQSKSRFRVVALERRGNAAAIELEEKPLS